MYLAFALDGGPQLGELGEVDALVAVLVRLVDEALGLALSHGATHLLHQLPQLVLGDHAVTVHVEELESLERDSLCENYWDGRRISSLLTSFSSTLSAISKLGL